MHYLLTIMCNYWFIPHYPIEPPPMPKMVSVSIDAKKIIFKWNGMDVNCPSMGYNFSSSNCGHCVSTNFAAATCIDFTLSPSISSLGLMCRFSVYSVICGNIRGEESTASLTLRGNQSTLVT